MFTEDLILLRGMKMAPKDEYRYDACNLVKTSVVPSSVVAILSSETHSFDFERDRFSIVYTYMAYI